jgi:putative inorganic carbon (HCO3(-)) transporter
VPFYNLGLEGYLPYALYTAAIAAFLLSIFRGAIFGLYFLIPLIPLQTIRYRLNDLPLGASVVYIILFAVGIGILRERRPLLPKTPWTTPLTVYILFTLASLWAGAAYLSTSAPLPGDQRFNDWLAYMTMPALFFAVTACVDSMKEIKIMGTLMCLATFALSKSFYSSVSDRDFSTYSEDLRQSFSDGGSMGYAGVNGLAAYEAQAATFLIAMAAMEKRFLVRLAYLGLALYAGLCVMYSLSRGAYLAILAGFLFMGLVKERKLLVLLAAFALVWTAVVPGAVVMRVQMTKSEDGQLDHSSELRVQLWEDAMELIRSNPVTGCGFNTYAYMRRVGSYADTHNYYLKILVETGIVGLLVFIWIIGKSCVRGLSLFRHSRDPYLAGLGLGLAGWVICTAVSITFGDRWSYLQIQGFFWVLAGLVARGAMIQSAQAEMPEPESDGAAYGPVAPELAAPTA